MPSKPNKNLKRIGQKDEVWNPKDFFGDYIKINDYIFTGLATNTLTGQNGFIAIVVGFPSANSIEVKIIEKNWGADLWQLGNTIYVKSDNAIILTGKHYRNKILLSRLKS